MRINATIQNRKVLRAHAREALLDYSPVMTWLLLDNDGDLYIITEPQGQTEYTGNDEVIAQTGGFRKAHGDGAAKTEYGDKYRSQSSYLTDLIGADDYNRVFVSAMGRPQEMAEGKRVNVYLDAPSLDTAQKLGDGNVSAGIRKALADQ
jgi:hypothetical protein